MNFAITETSCICLKEFTFFLTMAEQSVFALLYTVGLSLVYPINVWLWRENIKRGFAFGSRCFFPISKYVYLHTVFIYRPGLFICFGLVLGLESSFGQLMDLWCSSFSPGCKYWYTALEHATKSLEAWNQSVLLSLRNKQVVYCNTRCELVTDFGVYRRK